MKEITVLRHAEKDAGGNLTADGKAAAETLGERIGTYDLVYSSDSPRAIETAVLLSGNQPAVDPRAGAISLTPEEVRITHEQGKIHRFGIAGVLFDSKMYRPRIIAQGQRLATLITGMWNMLPPNGRALVISHDGVMVAAYMILMHKELVRAEKTFRPLQGFRITGNFSVEDVR
jgi:broad specificity phosphatase PhoE